MSRRGFKHNASTESLNRWVKEKFFKTYGCKFKNIQNFYDTLENLFITLTNYNFWNIIYLIKKPAYIK
ncbi:hypothetical protein STURON_00426 [Spiroplasma turonicum]|uniref:Uncharacterized protein n=1 Tax=Spiroplasma turonicum TaxID=216946 RepID=A0A0K1P709_9MOLU|nr:hypothetical protein STURON_00426 [Spiroplasma turonicum]ALX70692.1 hypothetical protein STURO_v1c04240 [Spiroplasma turonicum]